MLRLALGVFKTSPVKSLYSEVNEPLLEMRQKACSAILSQSLILPLKPTYKCTFFQQHTPPFNENEDSIKPYSLWMKYLLSEAQIHTEQIHKSIRTNSPPWPMEQHVLLELKKYPKTKTHPTKFQEEFHTIKIKYNDYLLIYTDGCATIHKKIKNWRKDSQMGLPYTVWNYQLLI